jgi:hypothetical protein
LIDNSIFAPSGAFLFLRYPYGFDMSENNQTKSNGRGGARDGAGRKPGTANTKTREIADKAAAADITPLEVMLEAMHFYRTGGDIEKAAMFAKDAAPYIHAKLASVAHTGANGGAIEHAVSFQVVGVLPQA